MEIESSSSSNINTNLQLAIFENYSAKITQNGYTSYYVDGKRVSKKKIPKNVIAELDNIIGTIARSATKQDTTVPNTMVPPELDDLYSYMTDTPGYTFLIDAGGKKLYLFNDKRILKRHIPKEELDNMANVADIWSQRFREYMAGDIRNNRKYRHHEEHNNIPSHSDFLTQHGINTIQEWRKWLLDNHPDRNPAADVELVQLINMAAHIVFRC